MSSIFPPRVALLRIISVTFLLAVVLVAAMTAAVWDERMVQGAETTMPISSVARKVELQTKGELQEEVTVTVKEMVNASAARANTHTKRIDIDLCPIITDPITGYRRLPSQGGRWTIPRNNSVNANATAVDVNYDGSNDTVSMFHGWNNDTQTFCSFQGQAILHPTLMLGDSTTQHIFSSLNGSDVTAKNKKLTTAFQSESGNIQMITRGRMFRNPDEPNGKSENIGPSNEAIRRFAQLQDPTAVLVYSIGMHEVLPSAGRKKPIFNITLLEEDVQHFVQLLHDEKYIGRLIYWRPHAVHKGRIQGLDLQVTQTNLRIMSDIFESHLHHRFAGGGAVLLLDFEYTTKYQVADHIGVHYPQLDRQHAILVEHAVWTLDEINAAMENELNE